jgi:DNA transposition AAA+ family ATPase
MAEIVKITEIIPTGRSQAFCETPTVKRIWDHADFIRGNGEIGLLIGHPGTGKTIALKKYAEDNFIDFCTMGPTRAHLNPALKHIAAVARARSWNTVSDLHDAIVTRYTDWRDDSDFLIIDEAQHLSDIVFDELRTIHDETGLPMLLGGNAALQSRLNKPRDAAFAAVTSRLLIRLELTKDMIPADVAALCDHYSVRGERAREILKRCAVAYGGLRQIGKLLTYAERVAGEAKPVTLEHLEIVARACGVRIPSD